MWSTFLFLLLLFLVQDVELMCKQSKEGYCLRVKESKYQIRGVKVVPMWEYLLTSKPKSTKRRAPANSYSSGIRTKSHIIEGMSGKSRSYSTKLNTVPLPLPPPTSVYSSRNKTAKQQVAPSHVIVKTGPIPKGRIVKTPNGRRTVREDAYPTADSAKLGHSIEAQLLAKHQQQLYPYHGGNQQPLYVLPPPFQYPQGYGHQYPIGQGFPYPLVNSGTVPPVPPPPPPPTPSGTRRKPHIYHHHATIPAEKAKKIQSESEEPEEPLKKKKKNKKKPEKKKPKVEEESESGESDEEKIVVKEKEEEEEKSEETEHPETVAIVAEEPAEDDSYEKPGNDSTPVAYGGYAVKYNYPPKHGLPLQNCFHNPSGYVCCNLELNNAIEATYKELREEEDFNSCNLQKVANMIQKRTEEMFDHKFEALVSFGDFAQNVHFDSDLVCKLEVDGKVMIAYGTPYVPAGVRTSNEDLEDDDDGEGGGQSPGKDDNKVEVKEDDHHETEEILVKKLDSSEKHEDSDEKEDEDDDDSEEEKKEDSDEKKGGEDDSEEEKKKEDRTEELPATRILEEGEDVTTQDTTEATTTIEVVVSTILPATIPTTTDSITTSEILNSTVSISATEFRVVDDQSRTTQVVVTDGSSTETTTTLPPTTTSETIVDQVIEAEDNTGRTTTTPERRKRMRKIKFNLGS